MIHGPKATESRIPGPEPGMRSWLPFLASILMGLSVRAATKPDVLFIVVDDLNDWISLLDEKAPIQTPHLERLASRDDAR